MNNEKLEAGLASDLNRELDEEIAMRDMVYEFELFAVTVNEKFSFAPSVSNTGVCWGDSYADKNLNFLWYGWRAAYQKQGERLKLVTKERNNSEKREYQLMGRIAAI